MRVTAGKNAYAVARADDLAVSGERGIRVMEHAVCESMEEGIRGRRD